VEVAGDTVYGLSAEYDPLLRLVAVVGSHGYVELAAPGGSAAALLGVERGAAVRVRAGTG
jgi:S-adenosylmethionine hydrolase